MVGVPNARALGRADWLIRMRAVPHAAAGIAEVLAAREDTSWVALVSGGAEITCTTRATTGDALVLPSLPRSPRIVDVTAQRLLRPVAGIGGWPARLAALTPDEVDEIRPCAGSTLTATDQLLLPLLARDGRTSYAALASATGWSAPVVARRVAELRRSGALSLHVDVEPGLFGAPQGSMLWLTVRPDALAAVGESLARHPDVAFAAVTTGATNLVVIVACADDDALHDDVLVPIGRIDGVTHVDLAPIARQISRSAPAPCGVAAGVPTMAR
ncbi:MAG: Lrp/AsnC family transcriptional regulator [Pseudonocardia sp.]|nr:Lrp/AsnC family transcriptional regulator [Pseudonocardia sp.]